MMIARTESRVNVERTEQLHQILIDTLTEVLRQGFYGSAAIEFDLDDGTILNARRRVERVDQFRAIHRPRRF